MNTSIFNSRSFNEHAEAIEQHLDPAERGAWLRVFSLEESAAQAFVDWLLALPKD